MKKFFAILLVLFLILCGCEAGIGALIDPNSGGEPTRPAEAEPIGVDGAVLCVTVTINPAFELYLDMHNDIQEVKAQNEDAENLLADLQVVGKSYSVGITQILAEAEAQGFLQNKAKLTISTRKLVDGGWNPRSEAAVLDPIEAYKEASGLVMTCDFYPAEKPLDEITSVHTNLREGYKEEICYNIYDQHILTRMYFDNGDYWETHWLRGTEYHWGADGSYYYEVRKDGFSSSYTIHPDGTVDQVMRTVDKLGNLRDWELFLYADGSSQENFYVDYTKSGDKTKSIYTNPDGSSEAYFYEDGEHVRTVYTNADGSIREVFYEDGRHTGTNFDGSAFETTFYSNGNLKTSHTTWPNGDYWNQTYYENGTQETDIQFREGIYIEQRFDTDGLLISLLQRDPDGAEYNYDYVQGEAIGYTMTYPNGDYEQYTYHKNGEIAKQIGQHDGDYFENYYDKNGKMTSSFNRHSDGTEYVWEYENGEPVGYTVTHPDGSSEYHTYSP